MYVILRKGVGPLTLFDPPGHETRPDDQRPRRRAEPRHRFLNRTTWREFVRVRELLEDWFASYPEQHRPDLAARFRSDDRPQHEGAFLELYCYTLLCALGHQVVVNTNTPEGKPDFLAEKAGREILYLEATALQPPPGELGQSKRLTQLLDALDGIRNRHFMLGVSVSGEGVLGEPNIGKLVREVAAELDHLDPTLVEQAAGGDPDAFPAWDYQIGEQIVHVTAIPRRTRCEGQSPGGSLAYEEDDWHWIQPAEGIRRSIRSKAHKYRSLCGPLVIALNDTRLYHYHRIDLYEALFGDEVMRVDQRTHGLHPGRKGNGVWRKRDGWHARNIGALMLFGERLLPHTVAKTQPYLLLHPRAQAELRCRDLRLPVLDPRTGRVNTCGTKSVHWILGLPENWPHVTSSRGSHLSW